MFATLGLILAGTALVGGYVITKNFVRRRLRYVDAVRRPGAPLVAGAVAAAALLPVTILPAVGLGTMLALGVGVAGGAARGRRPPRRPTSRPSTPPLPRRSPAGRRRLVTRARPRARTSFPLAFLPLRARASA